MDLSEIARIEELRAARGVAEVAETWQPWAGGRMSRGAPGLWCNVTIGAGFDGPVIDAQVQEMIEYYVSKGIEPRVELAPFAHDSLRAGLERAGFLLRMFEMLLARELVQGQTIRPERPTPPDIRYDIVDPGDEPSLRACAEVVIPGFKAHDALEPKLTDEEYQFFLTNARHPRCITVAARLHGGRIVAVGACSADESNHIGAPQATASVAIGSLFGAVTVKDQRRRGIQQGLIAFRLNTLAQRGVRLVTIGSRPDAATHRNVRRMGFFHAYTKVTMVRPGPGLIGVME